MLPVTPLVYTVCDIDTDGLSLFDLESPLYSDILFAQIVADMGDPNDYSVAYYTGVFADGTVDPSTLINSAVPYANLFNDQVIYVVLSSNVNQDSAGDFCAIQGEVTLHVELAPTTLLPVIRECDDDDDGMLVFDLTSYYDIITADDTSGLTITFYPEAAAIDLTTVPFTLDPTLVIVDPTTYVGSDADLIFVSLVNDITGCETIIAVPIHVDTLPTPIAQTIIDTYELESCINDGTGPGTLQDGYAIFDFTYISTIIDPQNGVDVTLSYYTSEADAISGTNAIDLTVPFYNTIAYGQTIWVRDENINLGNVCFVLRQIEISVPNTTVEIDAPNTILCIDENGVPLSSSDLPVLTAINVGPGLASDYAYEWLLDGIVIPGATSGTITVSQAGVYTVNVSHIQVITIPDFDDTLCSNTASVTITASASPGDYSAAVTTNAFADSHQILASATSSGNIIFNYVLDGDLSTTNTSGIFNDVTPGAHVVTISDPLGCWSDDLDVFIIDYPRFFTPNGDGINDYWAIYGQENIPISQIYIFDRFGKLLKQLDPDGLGWDGTYNGNPLPATDYWFKIIYIEGPAGAAEQKEFKAHFTLMR